MTAIDYFVNDTADLILVEYEMPGLSGAKILESVRFQPKGEAARRFVLENKTIQKQCEKVIELINNVIDENR